MSTTDDIGHAVTISNSDKIDRSKLTCKIETSPATSADMIDWRTVSGIQCQGCETWLRRLDARNQHEFDDFPDILLSVIEGLSFDCVKVS